jgi:hypothetical protein
MWAASNKAYPQKGQGIQSELALTLYCFDAEMLFELQL